MAVLRLPILRLVPKRIASLTILSAAAVINVKYHNCVGLELRGPAAVPLAHHEYHIYAPKYDKFTVLQNLRLVVRCILRCLRHLFVLGPSIALSPAAYFASYREDGAEWWWRLLARQVNTSLTSF
jgi:hypothetical protein